ncbi:MAG TPA: NUDIX domain-containing protein [Candidatus Saccharimonadales bacterium]|nr:NUDIX domain-containing protein [Candidatus Saccharimonadales bacterium]
MAQAEKPILWSGVLIIRDRRVLTLKERDKSFYIMPGGKVEARESDENAAAREALEELGVSVEIQKAFIEIVENSKNTGKLIRFKLFTGNFTKEPDIKNLPGRTESIAYINSQYKQDNIDVGNLLIKLLPELVKQDLID